MKNVYSFEMERKLVVANVVLSVNYNCNSNLGVFYNSKYLNWLTRTWEKLYIEAEHLILRGSPTITVWGPSTKNEFKVSKVYSVI